MLNKNIDQLVNILMENKKEQDIDREIVIFGLYLAMEIGLNIATAMVLGKLFGLMIETVIFLFSFSAIRSYAGGYHCKNVRHCYFLSSGFVVIALLIIRYIPSNCIIHANTIIIIISTVVLLKFAPLESPNKPLDETEWYIYRKRALINLAIECLLVFIMIKIQLYNISIAISLGIALSGLSLILDVFHNIRVSSCE